jgi:hypothetical protein
LASDDDDDIEFDEDGEMRLKPAAAKFESELARITTANAKPPPGLSSEARAAWRQALAIAIAFNTSIVFLLGVYRIINDRARYRPRTA